MTNQRFDSAPIFKVDGEPVTIQAAPGSSANLLVMKSSDGATLASINTSGAMTATTASPGTNTTQIATTEFVQTAIANLVASAPSALNTLDELAAALNDDANYATTINNALALKAPINSPTFTGTPSAPTPITGDSSTQIATTAFVASLVDSVLPAGMVSPYAGTSAPTGWLICAGQVISRTTYARLFSAIGTTYNTGGEPATDFRLPDLRGRVVAGLDANMIGAGGTGSTNRLTSGVSGINAINIGAAGGDERLHTHKHINTAAFTGNAAAHDHTQDSHYHFLQMGGSLGSATAGRYLYGDWNAGGSSTANIVNTKVSNAALWSNESYTTNAQPAVNSRTITPSGSVTVTNVDAGSGASQNVQPTIVLNYIIKV